MRMHPEINMMNARYTSPAADLLHVSAWLFVAISLLLILSGLLSGENQSVIYFGVFSARLCTFINQIVAELCCLSKVSRKC